MSNPTAVILVPIYKSELDENERYSLDYSLQELSEREIKFIGPENLNLDYYQKNYPRIPFVAFSRTNFESIAGYNRLLLDVNFYRYFSAYDFMLILQTDSIVLRDELDYWCSRPFDYIGAPWPDGVELFVNLGQFDGDRGRRIRAMVGNGGLSLRRIQACAELLQEFPEAIQYFTLSGSSEDLFFSFMGQLSQYFILPNEMTASRFALELKPSLYFSMNGALPMGTHAWMKYEPEFWAKQLRIPPPQNRK